MKEVFKFLGFDDTEDLRSYGSLPADGATPAEEKTPKKAATLQSSDLSYERATMEGPV